MCQTGCGRGAGHDMMMRNETRRSWRDDGRPDKTRWRDGYTTSMSPCLGLISEQVTDGRGLGEGNEAAALRTARLWFGKAMSNQACLTVNMAACESVMRSVYTVRKTGPRRTSADENSVTCRECR